MLAERGVLDLVVGYGEREHRQAGVHDLADDAVLRLLLESLRRVVDAGVQELVSGADLLVGLGRAELVARDAETSDRYDRPVHDVEAEAVVGLGQPRCLVAEVFGQAFEDLGRLDDVRITGIELHRMTPWLRCAQR